MRSKSEYRASDELTEKINNEFLEYYFYNLKTNQYKRNLDREQQILGIDTTFSIDGIDYSCDEKVAAHYINKTLRTFSFELSFIDRVGNVSDGWFISNGKLNDSYLFCWIDEAKSNKLTSYKDIIKAEIILIRKNKVIDYLKTISWTPRKLKFKASTIRNENDVNFGTTYNNGIKFSYSRYDHINKTGLIEEPINFILTRETLRAYCDYNEIIKVGI